MSKSLSIGITFVLCVSACSHDDTFCCALGKMADNSEFTSTARSTWRTFADSKNEEACKMEYDHEYDNYSSEFETALAQCADQ